MKQNVLVIGVILILEQSLVIWTTFDLNLFKLLRFYYFNLVFYIIFEQEIICYCLPSSYYTEVIFNKNKKYCTVVKIV